MNPRGGIWGPQLERPRSCDAAPRAGSTPQVGGLPASLAPGGLNHQGAEPASQHGTRFHNHFCRHGLDVLPESRNQWSHGGTPATAAMLQPPASPRDGSWEIPGPVYPCASQAWHIPGMVQQDSPGALGFPFASRTRVGVSLAGSVQSPLMRISSALQSASSRPWLLSFFMVACGSQSGKEI